jgi:replication initiation and membrane attachment protein DnaB
MIEIIQSLGFPIAMVLLLYYMLKEQQKAYEQFVQKIVDHMDEEIKIMRSLGEGMEILLDRRRSKE